MREVAAGMDCVARSNRIRQRAGTAPEWSPVSTCAPRSAGGARAHGSRWAPRHPCCFRPSSHTRCT